MPIVPTCTESSAAWALVCILQILATDYSPTVEGSDVPLLVAPPPGLEHPSGQLSYGVWHRDPPLSMSLLWFQLLSGWTAPHCPSL